ncbi:MAG: hypothetical protein Q8O37_12015 [Sulfuricellaceae bacterium]|nr:hypothetical protein [Sulfuricellaceae bacterium]
MIAAANLLANNYIYRCLRARALRAYAKGEPVQTVCELIEDSAHFTFRNHIGMFCDGRLENIAYRIGQDLEERGAEQLFDGLPRSCPDGATLHVVSNVFLAGGHSRMLAKWINRDHLGPAALVFTRPQQDLPGFFRAILAERNVPVFLLGNYPNWSDRALALRAIAATSRRVILHTHPDDVIPVLAFAGNAKQVPIAIFNHAHYWFCLGSTIASLYINTREYFRNMSERYRYARASYVLRNAGSELDIYSAGPVDKLSAKRALGYPDGQTILLTMGSAFYYAPAGQYDFFRTAQVILQQHDAARLVFVGISGDETFIPASMRNHPRVDFLGCIENPARHFLAADIFLESFPRPSLGATVQAAALGEAFPVVAYGVGENVNQIDRSDLFPGSRRAINESDYLRMLGELIVKPDETRKLARLIRMHLIEIDAGYEAGLAELYRTIDLCHVASGRIPAGRMLINLDTMALASQSERPGLRLGVLVDLLATTCKSLATRYGQKLRRQYDRHIRWRMQRNIDK